MLSEITELGRTAVYSNILVPIDGSHTANRGLHEAIQLARRLGSRMRLLHVVSEAFRLAPHAASAGTDSVLARMRRQGELVLREALRVARAAGIEADEKLLETADLRPGEPHPRRSSLVARASHCVWNPRAGRGKPPAARERCGVHRAP